MIVPIIGYFFCFVNLKNVIATLVLIAAIEKVSPQEIDLVQKASPCVLELSKYLLSNFELIFIASDVGELLFSDIGPWLWSSDLQS